MLPSDSSHSDKLTNNHIQFPSKCVPNSCVLFYKVLEGCFVSIYVVSLTCCWHCLRQVPACLGREKGSLSKGRVRVSQWERKRETLQSHSILSRTLTQGSWLDSNRPITSQHSEPARCCLRFSGSTCWRTSLQHTSALRAPVTCLPQKTTASIQRVFHAHNPHK